MLGTAIATTLEFLFTHRELIEEVFDAVAEGTPVEAIKLAVREAKKAASEAAIREEMGQ